MDPLTKKLWNHITATIRISDVVFSVTEQHGPREIRDWDQNTLAVVTISRRSPPLVDIDTHNRYTLSIHTFDTRFTARGGDQTSNICISRLDSFPVHSFEWRGLPFTPVKKCWIFWGLPYNPGSPRSPPLVDMDAYDMPTIICASVCTVMVLSSGYTHCSLWYPMCVCMRIQGGEDPLGDLSLQVVFVKRALRLVARLQKETYNLRHPMHFRHAVCSAWNAISVRVYPYIHTYTRRLSCKRVLFWWSPCLQKDLHTTPFCGETNQKHKRPATKETYGVATSSRLLKMMGLFCRI